MPPIKMNATDPYYQIETILDHRVRSDGEYEYFVKWQGYESDQNSWEPKENFASQKMLDDYHGSLKCLLKGNTLDINDATTNKFRKQGVLLKSDFFRREYIEKNGLQPEKVYNMFHLEGNVRKLFALIKFKGVDSPKFVAAKWAHKNCPQLVINFYESRIYWRETRTQQLVKGNYAIGEQK